MMSKLCLLAGAALVSTLISPGSLKSQTMTSIPVVNYLWTSNSVADGGYTTTTIGWTLSGSEAISVTLNRTTSPYIGQTGDQLGQIFTLGSFTGFLDQVLTSDFVPGDSYTLTADIDNDSGMNGWNLSIIEPGVAILASTAITKTSANTLAPFSVSWTNSVSGGSSLSSPIEIGLYNLSGTPSYEGIEIDNVNLTQTSPVPEPATWALFGVAILCALVRCHTMKRRLFQ